MRLTAAVLVLVAVVGGLMIRSISNAATFYYTVDEYRALHVAPNRTVQVKGTIVPQSIRWDGSRLDLSFVMEEKGEALRVHYSGVKPDTLQDGIEAVVTGRMQQGTFEATELMIKCPSKYQAAPPEASQSR